MLLLLWLLCFWVGYTIDLSSSGYEPRKKKGAPLPFISTISSMSPRYSRKHPFAFCVLCPPWCQEKIDSDIHPRCSSWAGLFTGHGTGSRIRPGGITKKQLAGRVGSVREVFDISPVGPGRVGSGRVRRFSSITGWVGPVEEVFKYRGSDRVILA